MRHPETISETLLGFNLRGLCVSALVLVLTQAAISENAVSFRASATAAVRGKPCPTCAQAIGLDAFRASVGGELTPVIIELQEPSGVMRKLAAEQAGRAMPINELIVHSDMLQGCPSILSHEAARWSVSSFREPRPGLFAQQRNLA